MNNKNVKKDLLEFGFRINKSTNINFVLEKIIEERSLNLLSTKRAVLYLLDEKKEFLVPQGSIDNPMTSNDPNFKTQSMKESIPTKSSLSGKVVKAKIGMIFNSTSELPDAYQIPGTSYAKNENLMVLPLIINDEVYGTINFYRDNIPYTEQELDLAKVYSMYASIAIENARTNDQLLKEINDRKENEQRFRLMFNYHHAVMLIIEPDTGKIIDANKAAEKFYGYSYKQLCSMNIDDINTLSKSAVAELRKKAAFRQKSYFEFEHKLADGSICPVEVHSSPIELDKSKVLFSIINDISKRKQAEDELKVNEAKFRSYIDNAPDGVFIADENGRYMEVNQAACDITGYSKKEFLGLSIADLLPPNDIEKGLKSFQELGKKGKIHISLGLLTKRGDNRFWEVSAVKLSDTRYLGFTKDITDKKETELELKQSHELMQYVIENTNSAVAIHDRELKYLYVSKNYLDQYKIKDKNIIGKHHYDVFPDLPQKWRDVHQKALKGEVSRGDYDPYYKADGTVEWTKWECRPWYESEGIIGGIIVYTEVITDRKLAEDELRRSEEKFKRFFNDNLAGAFISTPSGQLIDCNQAFIDLVGYPDKETALSTNTKNLYKKGANRKTKIDRLRKHQKINQYEEELIRFDGKKIYAVSNIWGDYDNDGELVYIQGYTSDITKIKEAEEELKVGNQRYQKAQEIAKVGNWEYNIQTTHFWGSDEAKRIYGFDPNAKDFTTEEVESCIPDRKNAHQALVDLIEKDKPYDLEFDIITKDKNIRKTIASVAELEKDKDGKPLKVTGAIQDVTERKMAEKKLLESYKMIEGIISSIPARVFWKDKDLKYLGCNTLFAQDAGFSEPEEIIGKDDFQMGWKDRAELYRGDDLEVIKGGKAKINIEEMITAPNGNTLELLTNKIPLRNSDNKIIGVLGTYFDITEKKKIERDIKESEAKYKNVIEHSNQMFYVHDTNNILSFVSPQSKQILGYKPDELLVNWTTLATNNPINEKAYELTKKAIKSGKRQPDYLLELKRKDGKIIIVRVNESPIKDENGHVVGISGSLEDVTRQIEAEEELKRSEEQFRSVLDNVELIGLMLDKDANIVYANDYLLKLTGHKKKEVIGKNWFDLFVDIQGTKSDVMKVFRKTAKEKNIVTKYANPILTKNGEERLIRWSNTSHKNRDGNIVLTSIGEDITDFKKHELEIIEKNKRLELFATIFENLNECITVTDKDHKIFYVNEAFKKLYGYKEEEYLGKTVDFLRTDNDPEYLKKIKKATNNGGWSGEIMNRKKDGTVFPIELSTTRIYDKEKNIIARIGIVKDITNKKKIQNELNSEREKYRALVENSTDAIYMIDKNGTVEFVNSYGAKLLGKEVDKVIGKNVSSLFPKNLAENQKESIKYVFETGEIALVDSEIEFPSGKIWLENILIPIFDDDGNVSNTIGVSRDISEKKKYEIELEEHRTNLEKLVSERTEELEEKNKMLDSSVKVFVGREQTIIKLKNKIKELEVQLEAAK